MPSKISIEFDQTEPIFYTGESISGRVTLTTESAKNARGVYVHLVGWCFVFWRDYLRDRTYYRMKKCMDVRNSVRGGGLLSIGTHNFRFSMTVPNGPSSCEKEYGKIFYELSLVIDRIRNSNNTFCQAITVLESYNVTQKPSLSMPIKKEKTNNIHCWCMRASPIIVTLSLPFGGYAPGQNMNYTLDINNQSTDYQNFDYQINVRLCERFFLKAGLFGRRSITNTLEFTKHRLNRMTTAKRSVTGSVSIPPLPPTSRDKCDLMIDYFLHVEISSKRNINMKIPIEIGTSPIVLEGQSGVKPYAYEHSRSKGFVGGLFGLFDKFPCHRKDDFKPQYPMYRNTELSIIT